MKTKKWLGVRFGLALFCVALFGLVQAARATTIEFINGIGGAPASEVDNPISPSFRHGFFGVNIWTGVGANVTAGTALNTWDFIAVTSAATNFWELRVGIWSDLSAFENSADGNVFSQSSVSFTSSLLGTAFDGQSVYQVSLMGLSNFTFNASGYYYFAVQNDVTNAPFIDYSILLGNQNLGINGVNVVGAGASLPTNLFWEGDPAYRITGTQVSAVPEPGSYGVMFGIVTLLMVVFRRFRARNAHQ